MINYGDRAPLRRMLKRLIGLNFVVLCLKPFRMITEGFAADAETEKMMGLLYSLSCLKAVYRNPETEVVTLFICPQRLKEVTAYLHGRGRLARAKGEPFSVANVLDHAFHGVKWDGVSCASSDYFISLVHISREPTVSRLRLKELPLGESARKYFLHELANAGLVRLEGNILKADQAWLTSIVRAVRNPDLIPQLRTSAEAPEPKAVAVPATEPGPAPEPAPESEPAAEPQPASTPEPQSKPESAVQDGIAPEPEPVAPAIVATGAASAPSMPGPAAAEPPKPAALARPAKKTGRKRSVGKRRAVWRKTRDLTTLQLFRLLQRVVCKGKLTLDQSLSLLAHLWMVEAYQNILDELRAGKAAA